MILQKTHSIYNVVHYILFYKEEIRAVLNICYIQYLFTLFFTSCSETWNLPNYFSLRIIHHCHHSLPLVPLLVPVVKTSPNSPFPSDPVTVEHMYVQQSNEDLAFTEVIIFV